MKQYERGFEEIAADLDGARAVLSIVMRELDEGDMIDTKDVIMAIYTAVQVIESAANTCEGMAVRYAAMKHESNNSISRR